MLRQALSLGYKFSVGTLWTVKSITESERLGKNVSVAASLSLVWQWCWVGVKWEILGVI